MKKKSAPSKKSRYSPSQAEKDLKAIQKIYEEGDPAIITPEVRDAHLRRVYKRLADTVKDEL